jgi:hypothetical protein
MMDRDSLKTLMDQAVRYVDSGLLPASIKTPQQALIIMAQGRELGIPSTVALRQIVVVQGKPTCSAELMLALVHRTYGQSAMRVFKTDNESCTVQYRQQGWDGVSEYTFTLEDAKRANLLKNPTWGQYPAAMLRARAISAVARFAFPECISGVYLPEEMGADVTVVDGEVVPAEAPTPDVEDGPSYCDAEHFNKAWHAAVKGTRFEDDETRHKYVAYYTGGKCESLTAFLKGATTEDAIDLIESIEGRIAKEAAKARRELIATLEDVAKAANDAGGEFEIPSNIAELSDDQVREMTEAIQATIAVAEVA